MMSPTNNQKIMHNLVLARTLHQQGNLTQAAAAYKKILRLAPTQPDALHYLGLVLYQTGQVNAALVQIKRALVIAPHYADAMNNLANIYKETGKLIEAQALYRRLLSIAPNHTNALINLAIVLRQTQQKKEALHLIHRALALDPQHLLAHHNLGNIQIDLQQYEQAKSSFLRVLAIDPQHHQATKQLAYVLTELDETQAAIKLLENLMVSRPDDAIAQHLLTAYSQKNTPTRATDNYIKQTFDDYSSSFNLSLAQLNYQVPELIAEKVLNQLAVSGEKYDILDLGCGTGLCAPLLKPVTRQLVGVDLSAKMLAQAAELKLYAELHETELCMFMLNTEMPFDYIICADTFVYFGELQHAFTAAFSVLKPASYFIFSVEQHSPADTHQDYFLQLNGRYSHTKTYIESSLQQAGFTLCSFESIVPRFEKGKAVAGAMIVAIKTL
ncbi:tetratricopeptide repeat protein [Rheinheimera sp. UJ63]|uniref:tetratricopeptide repeat protein n=1 Tax=Rheinheimera sp. UJ63 TaxID=2910157 RepID=UPI001F277EAC|nr:tetratricopeptide repeat protein [Rheinheimera sp. UJ63]MCF4009170.1 tetratricopeptide repeat protein [Rheinheimera sp. UJ63]